MAKILQSDYDNLENAPLSSVAGETAPMQLIQTFQQAKQVRIAPGRVS
jgi:hypothetical protein